MKKIAHELDRISGILRSAGDMREYVQFRITGVDPKRADFVNSVCSDIDDLADRIRRNEGLVLSVERKSEGDDTEVTIRMSDHEAAKAIREELVERVSNLGKKRKLDIAVKEASRRVRAGSLCTQIRTM